MNLELNNVDERNLVRTCIRWYIRKTEKQIIRLRERFGEQADVADIEVRLEMLFDLYERISKLKE